MNYKIAKQQMEEMKNKFPGFVHLSPDDLLTLAISAENVTNALHPKSPLFSKIKSDCEDFLKLAQTKENFEKHKP